MTKKKDFHEQYAKGHTPWEINRPDHNLTETIDRHNISPRTILDFGCGTGNNSIWLAQQGFRVTACDSVALALEQAQEKARNLVDCQFHQINFLKDGIPGAPFAMAFDRGCFHCFKSSEQLTEAAAKVATILHTSGLWLSLIGNSDEDRQEEGPPQLSAQEICRAVEPFFKILDLTASYFTANHDNPPKAWICLMEKRPFPGDKS